MSSYIGRTYGEAVCKICNSTFTKKSGNGKYCSSECSLTAHNQTGIGFDPRPCKTCNTMIQTITNPCQKFCEPCLKERKREQNRIRAQDYRRKQGAKKIGETIQCADCGCDIIRTTGIKKVCESCSKRREADRSQDYVKRNPEKAKDWSAKGRDNYDFGGNRATVLERDNHTCRVCGATEGRLHVHHIDGKGTTIPADERNNEIDNLITLCHSCHPRVHNINRWRNVSLREALKIAMEEAR